MVIERQASGRSQAALGSAPGSDSDGYDLLIELDERASLRSETVVSTSSGTVSDDDDDEDGASVGSRTISDGDDSENDDDDGGDTEDERDAERRHRMEPSREAALIETPTRVATTTVGVATFATATSTVRTLVEPHTAALDLVRPSPLLEPRTSAAGHPLRLCLRLDESSHCGVRLFSTSLFQGKRSTHTTLVTRALAAARLHLLPPSRPAFHNDLSGIRVGRDATALAVESEMHTLTLIVRPMLPTETRTAYTVSANGDEAHKEIHLSAELVASLVDRWTSAGADKEKEARRSGSRPSNTGWNSSARKAYLRMVRRVEVEIRGLLVREIARALSFDGGSSAPPALIDGMAEWARRKSCLGPQSSPRADGRRNPTGARWDANGETTARFLDFAARFCKMRKLVPRLNQALAYCSWNVVDERCKTLLRRRRIERGGGAFRYGEAEEEFTLFEVVAGQSIGAVWRAFRTAEGRTCGRASGQEEEDAVVGRLGGLRI